MWRVIGARRIRPLPDAETFRFQLRLQGAAINWTTRPRDALQLHRIRATTDKHRSTQIDKEADDGPKK
jgi:hypothetical protein